jgi:cobalt-zinc-cadmium efflux system outer membrane protein
MIRNILMGAAAASVAAAAGCGTVITVDDISTRLGAMEAGAAAPRGEAPAAVTELTLDEALRLARAWAPALHRAGAGVLSARGAVRQAGVWANPELELEAEDGGDASAGFDGNTVYTTRLSWQLPIFTGRSASIAAAESELAARRVHVEHERAELEGRVRRAYTRALAARQALGFAETTERLAAEAVQATERLQAGGEVGQGELLQAQIAHDHSEEALAHAKADVATALRGLAASMGLPALRIGALGGTLQEQWPVIDAATTLKRCNSFAPEVRAAEARLRAAQAAVTAADGAGWPEPVLSVGTATGRGADGRETAIEWGVGIAIPVFDANRGAVAQAQGAVLAAAASHREAVNTVLSQGAALVAGYDLARDDLTRYQTHIVPHAEEALGLIRAGFPAQYSLRDLILAQQTLAQARQERLARVIRLSHAAVALETLTGRPLSGLAAEPAPPEEPGGKGGDGDSKKEKR